ncbi:MAG: PIN domain-containing protein [Dehalococcoidia bacterium]|nr:PIN domain-containing protein [Dehalococcoidia bacterium]
MSGDFLDSNVLVYLLTPQDDRKHRISRDIVVSALEGQSATISYQVVQETLNVLTRRLLHPITAQNLRGMFQQFLLPLWTVMPSPALYESALSVRERYQYSFYDSLIIAAALEAGCGRLLSEDLQHDQQIEGLRIVNPFR